jgi:hypothetical protein
MRAIYATAIDRRRKDHVAAARVLLAYEAGLPPQGVEYRFPDGTLMAKSEEQIWAEMERRAGEGTAAVEDQSGEDKPE